MSTAPAPGPLTFSSRSPLGLEEALRRALLALGAATLACLAVSGGYSAAIAIPPLLVYLAAALRRDAFARAVGRIGAAPLAVVMLVTCLVLGRRLSPFDAIMLFLWGMLLLKMASPLAPRDMIQFIGLTFIILVAISTIATTASFFLPLLAYIVFLVVALSHLTALRDFRATLPPRRPGGGAYAARPQLPPGGLRAHWLGTNAALLLAMTFLFFFIPRLSSNALMLGIQEFGLGRASGFSEEIEFGTLAPIQLDTTVIGRATPPPGDVPSYVRLRGVSVDYFDGSTWRRTSLATPPASPYQQVNDIDLFTMMAPSLPQHERHLREWRIQIDRNASNILFVPYLPRYFMNVKAPINHDTRAGLYQVGERLRPKLDYVVGTRSLGEVDSYPGLFAEGRDLRSYFLDKLAASSQAVAGRGVLGEDRATLEARRLGSGFRRESDTGGETPEEAIARRATTLYEREINDLYRINTQMPRVLATSARFAELTAQFAADKSTRLDIARAIASRLKVAYQYSLDLTPPATELSVLESFLFETGAGHCEYFASAMAMMLRQLQIPARVVNGYYSDEFNNLGDYFVIRESHAHSWVEVFFDELGWLPFDPTPEVGIGASRDSSALVVRWIGWVYDSFKVMWYRYVLDYDIQLQRQLFSEVWAALTNVESLAGLGRLWRERGAGATRTKAAVGLMILAPLGVMGGGLLLWRRRRRSAARRRTATVETTWLGAPQAAAATMMRRVRRRAERWIAAGRRVPALTAHEVARSLGGHPGAAPAVERFAEAYSRLRFGEGDVADVPETARLADAAERTLKSRG